MENDWYQSVLEEGIEQGILDGYHRGLEAGQRQGVLGALVRLLERKLGGKVGPRLHHDLQGLTSESLSDLLVALGESGSVPAARAILRACLLPAGKGQS